jgi:eukaryotic-like serine/threonine-protein kinase
MHRRPGHFYEFESFCLDVRERLLTQRGKDIPLAPKTFEALLVFVRDPGHLIHKDDLLKQLWPDTFVEEANLTKHISLLRKVLGKTGTGQEYIETIPKHGYRFVVSVTERDGLPEESEEEVFAFPGSMETTADPDETVSSHSSDTESVPLLEARRARIHLGRDPAEQEVTSPGIVTKQWNAKYLAAISGAAILFLAVVGFAARVWRLHNRTFDLNDLQIVQITDTGKAVNVAISPDGRYVAYALQDGEKESLRLRQLATRSDLQILPLETGSFAGLTFSPDSNYIYFVRSDRDDPAFHSLYMMPALGGPQHQVMKDVDSAISFSPDARQFVFTRGAPQQNSVEVRTASSDGAREKLLATLNDRVASYQFGPTWSPDGRTIALSATQWGKQLSASLVTVSLSDGNVRELYYSPDPIGRPVWSRGGDELLVPMNDRVNRNLSQLWAVSYPEGKARQLTKEIVDHDLRISATTDAKMVARISVTQVSNVWVAEAADLHMARQITSDNFAMSRIAETSDGMLLVTGDDGKLWSIHADGSNRALFATARGAPVLCGRFILFLEDTGAMILMRANADGSHPTPLVNNGDIVDATCSPDGKLVFYASSTRPQKIRRITVEGGAPVDIATAPGDGIMCRFGISPDGKHIAYVYRNLTDKRASGWRVDVIPADGGPTEKTIKVPAGIWALCWAPDGRGVQFLFTLNGVTNVWEQRFEGGPPKQLSRFTSGQMFDFNWSPDHSRLLMLHGETRSDVVLYSSLR